MAPKKAPKAAQKQVKQGSSPTKTRATGSSGAAVIATRVSPRKAGGASKSPAKTGRSGTEMERGKQTVPVGGKSEKKAASTGAKVAASRTTTGTPQSKAPTEATSSTASARRNAFKNPGKAAAAPVAPSKSTKQAPRKRTPVVLIRSGNTSSSSEDILSQSSGDIPLVDYAGVVQHPGVLGRAGSPARGPGASARKSKVTFARTPLQSALPGKPTRQTPNKRGAAEDSDEELVDSRAKRSRERPRTLPTPEPEESNPVRDTAGSQRRLVGATANDETMTWRPGQPSGEGRGTTISATNPRYVPGTRKLNPFFETMPAPEVWHRNMPPFFSFGETPFMERVVSNQINDDLARGLDENSNEPQKGRGFIGSTKEYVGNLFGMKSKAGKAMQSPVERAKEDLMWSPWALPNVSDDEDWATVEGESM